MKSIKWYCLTLCMAIYSKKPLFGRGKNPQNLILSTKILLCLFTDVFFQFPGSYISQSSQNTAVYWGHSSVLEAELLCLQDLLHNNKSWQYAIDLTGSEVEV